MSIGMSCNVVPCHHRSVCLCVYLFVYVYVCSGVQVSFESLHVEVLFTRLHVRYFIQSNQSDLFISFDVHYKHTHKHIN